MRFNWKVLLINIVMTVFIVYAALIDRSLLSVAYFWIFIFILGCIGNGIESTIGTDLKKKKERKKDMEKEKLLKTDFKREAHRIIPNAVEYLDSSRKFYLKNFQEKKNIDEKHKETKKIHKSTNKTKLKKREEIIENIVFWVLFIPIGLVRFKNPFICYFLVFQLIIYMVNIGYNIKFIAKFNKKKQGTNTGRKQLKFIQEKKILKKHERCMNILQKIKKASGKDGIGYKIANDKTEGIAEYIYSIFKLGYKEKNDEYIKEVLSKLEEYLRFICEKEKSRHRIEERITYSNNEKSGVTGVRRYQN